jgi:hypothetical protein
VVQDAIELQISRQAMAVAGNDRDVCGAAPVFLGTASASNYSGLFWSTSGDGTFNNPTVLTPSYFAGPGDLTASSVVLTLEAFSENPCENVSSSLELTYTQPPLADAGSDVTACPEPLQLNTAGVENASSVIWETSGDGTFDNPSALHPVYFPGTLDIDEREVTLTLSALPQGSCTLAAVDEIKLSIDTPQIGTNFVVDKTVIAGGSFVLIFSANSYSTGQYTWYKDGEIIPGENSIFLIVTNTSPLDAGEYRVVFENQCGTVESDLALVEVLQPFAHELNIPAGWSGISSYVTPDAAAMESVFSSVQNDLVLLANNDGLFWPGQNINTFGDFSVSSGYQVKMLNAAALQVDGNIRYPLQPLSIDAGWSYLPVNTNCEVDVMDQFGSEPSIEMIKEIAGTGIYWPQYGINTLESLLPGRAYFILNNDPELEIKYAGCTTPFTGGQFKDVETSLKTPWNQVLKTPVSHVFAFDPQLFSSYPEGTIIGAFDANGHCAGASEIDFRQPMNVISVFGKDQMDSSSSGIASGEQVFFKLFNPQTGSVLDMVVDYQDRTGVDGLFEHNGMSVFANANIDYVSHTTTNLTSGQPQISIYPNPTKGTIYIAFQDGHSEDARISVSNHSGQIVMDIKSTANNATHVDLSTLPKGVYYLKIQGEEFAVTKKVVLH